MCKKTSEHWKPKLYAKQKLKKNAHITDVSLHNQPTGGQLQPEKTANISNCSDHTVV